MPNGKTYVVEGKYTTGPGSQWEELTTISPEEGGLPEAQRVCNEHRIAAPYGQHRVRPQRPDEQD